MNIKTMLFAVSFLILSVSGSAQYAEAGKVAAMDLKYLLDDCRNTPNEARCLRRGIQRLVRQSEMPAPPPQNLVCRSGNNGKFAVYDNDQNRFLDSHYFKTADECRRTISASYTGLICSVGGNEKFAVRRISDAKFLSPNYSIDLSSCLKSVEYSNSTYICLAGGNGLFARYDMQRGTYLDTNYSMNIDDCVNLIP